MEALKRYLRDQNITQASFAQDIGVGQGTVSDWLNGKIEPSFSNLRLISARTRITIDELVGPPPKKSSRERRANP